MKKLLILLLLFSSTLNAQIKQDKYMHLGVGGALAITTHFLLPGENVNPYKGLLIVAPITVGKEYYDVMNGGIFSLTDIAASIIIPAFVDTGVYIFKRIRKKRQRRNDPYDWDNDPLLTSN